MKLSLLTPTTLVLISSLVPSTNGGAVSVDATIAAGLGDGVPGSSEWTDIFGSVRMGVSGIKKDLAPKDMAFAVQAFKRAYNSVHAPLDDDYFVVGSNITAIEMKRMKKGTTPTMMFSDAVSRIRWPKSFYTSIYYLVDISCQLCGKNDDALLDVEDELSFSSSLVGGGGGGAWAHPQSLADLFCKIIKTEGDHAVFGNVKGCDLFPISFLGAWDYEEQEEPQPEEHLDDTNVAITLTGLNCADDTEACNSEDVRQLVSDAFTLAYNQVYFHDYLLSGFTPSSLIVLPAESGGMTPPPVPALGSLLRGAAPADTTPTTSTNLPIGTWHGTVQAECRFCHHENAETNDLQVKVLTNHLEDVEEIFCALMANFDANENIVLSTLEDCSIATVRLVSPAEYHNLVVLEDN